MTGCVSKSSSSHWPDRSLISTDSLCNKEAANTQESSRSDITLPPPPLPPRPPRLCDSGWRSTRALRRPTAAPSGHPNVKLPIFISLFLRGSKRVGGGVKGRRSGGRGGGGGGSGGSGGVGLVSGGVSRSESQ